MKNEWSVRVTIFWGAIGFQKLGHPVPESNLVSELNSAVPQQTHRYSPFACNSSYSFANGRSVPPSRVTLYCSAVSCFLHSASLFTTLPSEARPAGAPESLNSAI